MSAIAFPAPVLTSQAAFRALMDAFARPGLIQQLAAAVAPPTPLSGTAAAVSSSLVDYETPVWLDAALTQSRAVADWIRLQTGARVIDDPKQAAFAFVADPMRAPAFDAFSLGTPEYPDRSTTVVLQVDEFGQGERLLLSGPGIADTCTFSARSLPSDFPARMAANRALFPRGIDLILVSADAVAALPRSVSLVPERG
jgi:alpha-D-ribose 1-methylphosphonate 5-triphosphate synthase subunit PhnH